MSLSEFKPDTLEVKTKKVSFEVRGLSFIDLSSLLRTHLNDLESLFTLYEKDSAAGAVSNMAMARYATSLIREAPGLVAHIIALAADEPEMVNNAARLPLLAQTDALQKIGKLTFEEVGGVKKLMAQISQLASDLRGNQGQPSPPAKK